jgi:hypothetical protein
MIFFLVLGVLAITAIVVPLLYNLQRQLEPEDIARARQRWQEHGLANYDLLLLVRADEDKVGTRYLIQVRSGKVTQVLIDGEEQDLPDDTVKQYRVEGLFAYIAKMLHQDREANARNFTIADFDKVDGHPTHYIRRVRGTRERLEWVIRLDPQE